MSRLFIFAAAALSLCLTGCNKKSEAEIAEEERVKVREEKRQEAAKYYKVLADQFSDHEKAKEAAGKAGALGAPAPKK